MVLGTAISTQHAFGQTGAGCSFHKPSQPALQQELSPYGCTAHHAGGACAQHRPFCGARVGSSVWRHVAPCWGHTQRRPCDGRWVTQGGTLEQEVLERGCLRYLCSFHTAPFTAPLGRGIFLRRFSKGMTHLQWVGPSWRPFRGRQVGRPIVGSCRHIIVYQAPWSWQ